MNLCINPFFSKVAGCEVPCGKCGNCIKRRISDWTLRCQVEQENSFRTYFITLTYEQTDGRLYKTPLQKYFKRLRKAGLVFKYFALGDYGDAFGRPHYHALVFAKNHIDVAEYFRTFWTGTAFYENGAHIGTAGFSDVVKCTFSSIRYVVTYGVLAKIDWCKDDERPKPFFVMSRRPAIGADYLCKRDRVAWHKRGNYYFPDGRFKRPLPRYFRDKLFNRLLLYKRNEQYFEQMDYLRQAELRRLSKLSAQPIQLYNERVVNKSNVFLDGLRKKKHFKQFKHVK